MHTNNHRCISMPSKFHFTLNFYRNSFCCLRRICIVSAVFFLCLSVLVLNNFYFLFTAVAFSTNNFIFRCCCCCCCCVFFFLLPFVYSMFASSIELLADSLWSLKIKTILYFCVQWNRFLSLSFYLSSSSSSFSSFIFFFFFIHFIPIVDCILCVVDVFAVQIQFNFNMNCERTRKRENNKFT